MLKKLLKYDLKAVSPILLAAHGAVLFFTAFGRVLMALLQVEPFESNLSALYSLLLLFAIFALTLFTTIYLGMYYYRSFYTDEGYLTNTLPVTANRQVLSKYLCGLLWTWINALVVALCVFILFYRQFIQVSWKDVFSNAPASLVALTILIFVVELFSSCLMVYCAVALGSLFRGHRVMGCIGGYIFLYLINQLLGIFILFPTLIRSSRNQLNLDIAAESAVTASQAISVLNRFLLIALLVGILVSILYYVICVKILDRKLEMD